MSKSKDDLGDRMKAYEAAASHVLMHGTPKVIRLDGKAFHTWTKKVKTEQPYDKKLMDGMIYAATAVMDEMGGMARYAYIQSDECSIGINDAMTIHTQPWFGNKIQKMVSVAASIMSVKFNEFFANNKRVFTEEEIQRIINPQTNEDFELMLFDKVPPPAYFDARIFQLPSTIELHNAFLWRQFDASKNSVSQYARHYFSHKQLQGKNGSQMQDMMMLEKQFNWNDAPTWTKRGVVVRRVEVEKEVEALHNLRIGNKIPEGKVIRHVIEPDWEIPEFNKDPEYLKGLWYNE